MKDDELLALLRKSPERGLRELMNRYCDAVATICRNFLYDFPEGDIEETIADTFIKFWRSRYEFQLNEKYSLKSYLYAIARNAARDRRRKERKADIFSLEELQLELPDGFDLEKEVQRKEYEAILHTCLEQMREPDKSVFLYRYFYGYPIKDIAGKLLLTPKQVENILYRGKEKLRKDLADKGVHYESC